MNEEKRTERIEAYLLGHLSAEEASQFELEISNDDSLRAEVATHRRTHAVLEQMNAVRLKEHLKTIDREETSKSSAVERPMYKYRRIAIAASIIVIVGLAAIMITQPFGSTPALAELSNLEVAQEYFSPTSPESRRGITDNLQTYQDSLASADDAFLKGNYPSAIKMYSTLAQRDHVLAQRAEWNLALSYLAYDDMNAFTLLLNEISSDPKHTYYQKAKELHEGLSDD